MFQFGLNGDVPQFSPHADVPRQFSLNVPQFSPQTVVFRVQTKVPITPMFQLTREISFFLSFPFSVSLLSLSFSYPPVRPDPLVTDEQSKTSSYFSSVTQQRVPFLEVLTTHGEVGLRW